MSRAVRDPKRVRNAAVIAACAALYACGAGDRSIEPSPPPPQVAGSVIGTAAAALGADGLFKLNGAPVGANELSSTRASSIAEVWGRRYGPMLRSTLEREHGEPIRFDELHSCGRPLYAESPFEAMKGVPEALNRHLGPQWLIGLCELDGRLAVSLAVSALATAVKVVNGDLDMAGSDGNEFFAMGVPGGWDSPVGISPERAVERAAKSRRMITAVPRLLAASPSEGYPQGARWEVVLDGEAEIVRNTDGRRLSRDRLYIGIGAGSPRGSATSIAEAPSSVPADSQPEGTPVWYLKYPESASGSELPLPTAVAAVAHRRSEMPIRFDRVTLAEGD